MITIFKYDITEILEAMDRKIFSPERTSIYMPRGAEILYTREQDDKIMIWAKVDTGRPSVPHRFFVFGTGWAIDSILREMEVENPEYIGTVGMDYYVWHVFDGGEIE